MRGGGGHHWDLALGMNHDRWPVGWDCFCPWWPVGWDSVCLFASVLMSLVASWMGLNGPVFLCCLSPWLPLSWTCQAWVSYIWFEAHVCTCFTLFDLMFLFGSLFEM